MQAYGVNDLRRMFLEFFERQEHLAMKSFSLVPVNDNSLLIINSGMAPLKPYFTGQEIPPKRRVTTCQKCIRTGDIENVGKTARHLTFFEMLGNFSFGDYFKKEALQWSWEFLTKDVGLDPDRLYPSIFMDDDEAYDIWTNVIGVDPSRITKFGRGADGKSDNFWEHGSGPCGPCSEIYYDRGEQYESGVIEEFENAEGFLIGKDSERYIEVWNDVFTQFDGDGKGNYTELESKNIDTGMGLERLAVVVQDVNSVFDIDTMCAIRDKVCEIAHVSYGGVIVPGGEGYDRDCSVRVIVDHIRSATFMISDGIMPSNEGRGYVLRRLIRRAARHGRKLGIEGTFLNELTKTVIEGSKDGYPELDEKRDFIISVLTEEENKFEATIDQGLRILSDLTADMKKTGSTVLKGEEAFRLYDTFGFPLDLTTDILAEQGMTVDEAGFEAAMEHQRATARAARKVSNYMGADATVYDELDPALTSVFDGYDTLEHASEIIAMTVNHVAENEPEDAVTDLLGNGLHGTVIVKETPFYGTMGGQVGDTGLITGKNGTFEVLDTVHLAGGKIAHIGIVTDGAFRTGETVTLSVNAANRNLIRKNHSATHLLHKALRLVLGTHVEQAGSLVDANKLRFDFSHFQAMTGEEIAKVEKLVNDEILTGLPVETKVMSLEDAKKTGAMALFGEKYGDEVRVVRMGDFSTELCGGTRVDNTGVIGPFRIVSESGVAAGVRRIEALTGDGLMRHFAELERIVGDAAGALKTQPDHLTDRIAALQKELKDLKSELESAKSKQALSALGDAAGDATDVKNVRLVAKSVDGVDMNGLRDLGDTIKERVKDSVVVLCGTSGGKVNLVVMATDEAVRRGAHAGNLVKTLAPLIGGKGGGRPNMAQAGGGDASGIEKLLADAKEVLSGQL